VTEARQKRSLKGCENPAQGKRSAALGTRGTNLITALKGHKSLRRGISQWLRGEHGRRSKS
jgi:hypothetical protein